MHIELFDDHEWASNVAERWISHMSDHPDSRICVPTGETPRPVYASAATDIDLSEATVFLLDEFDLPSGNAARCDSMLQRDLLNSLAVAPKAFHRLDVDTIDADAECARFDSLVDNGGLDLTLLGLGGNGHLGLNEPGTTSDSRTRAVTLTPTTTRAVSRYEASAQPIGGLTLGLRRILESEEIWLLVTGSHKAPILAEMLNGPITSDLPASYLRYHSRATVFANRSAAAGL
jgi:6-phosphogluconolactonase/glucosamine-6-phosphate isomerase/deaminase